ncbi:MAG: hypothetical protein WCC41_06980, partial [Rhodomicrobium sp.]
DTIAALNTGSLYSRSGKLLSTFPTVNDYRLPVFKTTFVHVMQLLDDLRRIVVAFHEAYADKTSKYPFYPSKILTSEPDFYGNIRRRKLDDMDSLDEARNNILSELNHLLELSKLDAFDLIPLSSALVNAPKDEEYTEQEVSLLWGFPRSPIDEVK